VADVLSAGFVEVYLIDAVTGNVVFHCNHKKAKGPVRVVHSENWVVVSSSCYRMINSTCWLETVLYSLSVIEV